MEKYRHHFLNNVRKQLEEWEGIECISRDEVYRFLHSIAGTASIIGLEEMGSKAQKLMNGLQEMEEKEWSLDEVKHYTFELIEWCYGNGEEHFFSISNQREEQGEKPVILLIDDDTSFLMYMKEQLEKIGWYVAAIANPQKAISSFYDVGPDCVVIDIHMKEKNGFEVLEFLKEKLKQQFIPTVMVSVDHGKEIRMKSYATGADDFIRKPFDLDEFIVRVQRQLERKKLIDELLLLDELTHVYNRKYLKQAYAQLQNDWMRSKEPHCLAVLDIDYFKEVNDRYGHLVGDAVLQRFARFLKQETRMSDIVVRFGGEEFILLFPKTNLDAAYRIIERLRVKFRDIVFTGNSETFSCTFSCGIVEINETDKPFEHWLRLADNALYVAKNKGRNCVKLAELSKEKVYQKLIKIAVVDDDAMIRTIITDILAKLPRERKVKYEIQTFNDGVSFIESDWHKDTTPCLVILDGMMPKMDGLEVLQWLRKREESTCYKIIMLTSRKSENDIARALELGADDYITKPFKLLDLEERICQIVKRMS